MYTYHHVDYFKITIFSPSLCKIIINIFLLIMFLFYMGTVWSCPSVLLTCWFPCCQEWWLAAQHQHLRRPLHWLFLLHPPIGPWPPEGHPIASGHSSGINSGDRASVYLQGKRERYIKTEEILKLLITEYICECVFFLRWISITLSSEAQAFGHGFSWGHWNTESHWQRQRVWV